jgi:hypothetical protein
LYRQNKPLPPQEIILPGNVQPFITSPIYSRTNGYLKKWYVDIGHTSSKDNCLPSSRLRKSISKLEQSLSNLNTAKANLALAEITKEPLSGTIEEHAVAQQDVDNAVGTYNANKAIVEADQGKRGAASGTAVFSKRSTLRSMAL